MILEEGAKEGASLADQFLTPERITILNGPGLCTDRVFTVVSPGMDAQFVGMFPTEERKAAGADYHLALLLPDDSFVLPGGATHLTLAGHKANETLHRRLWQLGYASAGVLGPNLPVTRDAVLFSNSLVQRKEEMSRDSIDIGPIRVQTRQYLEEEDLSTFFRGGILIAHTEVEAALACSLAMRSFEDPDIFQSALVYNNPAVLRVSMHTFFEYQRSQLGRSWIVEGGGMSEESVRRERELIESQEPLVDQGKLFMKYIRQLATRTFRGAEPVVDGLYGEVSEPEQVDQLMAWARVVDAAQQDFVTNIASMMQARKALAQTIEDLWRGTLRPSSDPV